MNNKIYEVTILGAGASGLVCAAELVKNGISPLLIDANASPGVRLLATGGGKCNFTNININTDNYLSNNKSFSKSALARYGTYQLLDHFYKNNIDFEERDHGRLFTANGAKTVLDLLVQKTKLAQFMLNTKINDVDYIDDLFLIDCGNMQLYSKNIVIALGGMSYPSIGGSVTGLNIAKKFGHRIEPVKPGLVPLKINDNSLKELSGINLTVTISCDNKTFTEPLVFTHMGISGPAVLQISSYWQNNKKLYINFLPDIDAVKHLKEASQQKITVKNQMAKVLPKRLIEAILPADIAGIKCCCIPADKMKFIYEQIHSYTLIPSTTEGFNKAEVMTGGVDTLDISSSTMASKLIAGLYFIGEVLDITGELGGYNLHWAYASGMAAAQAITKDIIK